MSDGVIGSVGVAVVPDARAFWERFRAQTEGGAAEAGRRAGEDWRRGFDEATRGAGPSGRGGAPSSGGSPSSSSSSNGGGGGPLAGLISAAITLAPALVPLGAAAAAAGSEFAVLGATAALAVKGIQAEMASGTPTGAAYSTLLKGLKADLSGLESTAAHGVLGGFEQSVVKLRGDLPELNSVIAEQSTLLGDTVSHLTGGLIGGFKTFGPLLSQVGGSVDRIAAHFESWATGPGGAKFSSALSSDYAKVAPIIDDLAHTIARVVAASNGVGLGILSELGVLARVLDTFPTPVLTAIVAGFVGFRTINSINGVLTGLSGNMSLLGTRATASAAAVTAANLQIEASVAQTAAEVATAQAAEAAAVAQAQAEIAEALAGTGSVLESGAAIAAQTAAEEATSFQVAAEAAIAAAAEISAAADAAAVESATAGAAASASWSAMLGPVGIGVGLLAIFGLSMLTTSDDTNKAAGSLQTFTSALEQSQGVINDTVRANLANTLTKAINPDELKKTGLTIKDLTDDILGVPAAVAKYNNIPLGKFSNGLITDIHNVRKAFADAQTAAETEAQALTGVGAATAATSVQLSEGNTAIRGYVAAMDTFNKSTDTAADRGKLIGSVLVAANGDALSYVASMTAAAGAGRALSDAFTSDRQKIQDLRQQIAQLTGQHGSAATSSGVLAAQINKTGAAIAANKTRVEQLQNSIDTGTLSSKQLASAQSALANAEASGGVKTATLAAQRAKLNSALGGGTVNVAQLTKLQQELAKAYEDSELAAINLNKGTIDYTKGGAPALVGQLQAIQTASENAAAAVYQHELSQKGGTKAADDAFNVYKNETRGALIDQAKQLGLTVPQAKKLADQYFGLKNSGDIKKKIELIGEDKVVDALKGILQDLDILIGKTTVLDLAIAKANANAPKNLGSPGAVLHQSAGGFISGPGSGTSDSIPARLSNGEFVVNAAATARNRPALEAMNGGVQAFRDGGIATVVPSRSISQTNNYYYPVPERVTSSPTAHRAAASKLGRLG